MVIYDSPLCGSVNFAILSERMATFAVRQGAAMQINILGPIEVMADNDVNGSIALQGQRQRALLASLILSVGKVVSIDKLVDAVWSNNPPGTASIKVRGHVSALRSLLRHISRESAPVILTRPPGYLLSPERIRLDKAVHDDLVRDGRHALSAGDSSRASELLSEALLLWRGSAFADVDSTSIRREADLLEEIRMLIFEDRAEADLQLGRHIRVIAALSPAVAIYPLRERIRGQLMLALYRRGCRAEALAVYRAGHKIMVDELGLEPGPSLRRLHLLMLRDDYTLHTSTPQELLDPTGALSHDRQ